VSAAVVIPWDPATVCPWRLRWLPQLVAYWIENGFEITLGLGEQGRAIRNGVERTGDAETILLCFPDSVIGLEQARCSIELAAEAPGLVVPHDRYLYLSRDVSDSLTVQDVGRRLDENAQRWSLVEPVVEADTEFFGPNSVGGPVAFSRETYELAGGHDPQIIHGYDGAFALACAVLAGPTRRLDGDFVHLWHPRPDPSVESPPETWATLRRYHAAAEAGEDAMRALVEERAL
jgi:hypothetical protein